MAERVEHLAAGVDRLVAGEPAEEIIADPAQGIGDDEAAEPGLGRQHGGGIVVGRLHEVRGVDVERPQGQAVVTGVRGVLEGEGPVGGMPVGSHVLPREEDPHAVVAAMVVPAPAHAGVDEEVRPVADLDRIPPRQESDEEVVVGVETLPEGREADADGRAVGGQGRRIHARMVAALNPTPAPPGAPFRRASPHCRGPATCRRPAGR